jgi:hypothetical protein
VRPDHADPAARDHGLYGPAPAYRYGWALVLEPSQVAGPPNLIDRLAATIRSRRVVSLTVSPYGAGD